MKKSGMVQFTIQSQIKLFNCNVIYTYIIRQLLPLPQLQKKMPIDYGVWDNIEVSDDEDDTHPHIEKGSLFRWRHQARLERMAETKLELQELYVKKAQATKLMCEIGSVLNDSTDECGEKMIAEKHCQEKAIRECDERISELEKITRSWNVDTIGRDGFSKTYVNKASSSKLTEDDEIKLAADL
uniref:Cdc37 N-terminal domain-containing protein n=1 Tax=Romanomermis culicivorax TaxID=13658 RepID=A0A915JC33_ROMCU